MAQSYTTDQGTLIIPGAYSSFKVQTSAAGLATTGVIMLVGEAAGGPDHTLESDLSANSYGPDQQGDIIAKYQSGPLVDAFRAAAQPANDPDITGAPNRFIMVKTNPSTKASSALDNNSSGTYATLYDKNYGQLGNLIYYTVTEKNAEVKPTTGTFTWVNNVSSLDMELRVNGGAAISHTIGANTTPAGFVSALNAGAISATGGSLQTVLPNSGNLAVTVSGYQATVTYDAFWSNTPTVGQTMFIPTGSAIAGAGNANVGAYVITSATTNTVTGTKLTDANKSGAVAGTVTAPAAVSSTAVTATTNFEVFDVVTVTLSSTSLVDGIGKSLEINELTSGVDLLSRSTYALSTTPVTWVSKSGSATMLVSATEQAINLNVNRQFDNVQETISAGGQIAIKIGYNGTDCVAVVGPTTLTLTVTGGSGANQSINLKHFPTIADLASFISAQTGFTAAVGSNTLAQASTLALDEGTFHCSTKFGNQTLRLKMDAVKFYQAVTDNSVLIQLNSPVGPAVAGLPKTTSGVVYLAGGTRGATTDAVYEAAIDALEMVKGNFLVPCFSRDASADAADSLTDPSSSYTIATIQAYAKTHVLKMSTLKRRKNRQAFLANRGSFADAETAANTLATFRASLAFQDVKVVGLNGIDQDQPHILAALAAGMQAAGFYRAIFNKGINCNGVLQAAGDFKDANDSQVENALNAGLLIARKTDQGGFSFVSDQTTYSRDNNFVYNSIQAVYAADVIAMSSAQQMELAFVGQSLADVPAPLAVSAFETIMADFKRLKLIAASDDAPAGFKDLSIKITGGTMLVSCNVKLAGAIYFIPISFTISQVTSSATG